MINRPVTQIKNVDYIIDPTIRVRATGVFFKYDLFKFLHENIYFFPPIDLHSRLKFFIYRTEIITTAKNYGKRLVVLY